MHTVAVLQGAEDYNHMSEGFAPILDEINDVIENNNVVLNGQNFKLEFFLGGDYKVHNKILQL